jgi:hypothetical protein
LSCLSQLKAIVWLTNSACRIQKTGGVGQLVTLEGPTDERQEDSSVIRDNPQRLASGAFS